MKCRSVAHGSHFTGLEANQSFQNLPCGSRSIGGPSVTLELSGRRVVWNPNYAFTLANTAIALSSKLVRKGKRMGGTAEAARETAKRIFTRNSRYAEFRKFYSGGMMVFTGLLLAAIGRSRREATEGTWFRWLRSVSEE